MPATITAGYLISTLREDEEAISHRLCDVGTPTPTHEEMKQGAEKLKPLRATRAWIEEMVRLVRHWEANP